MKKIKLCCDCGHVFDVDLDELEPLWEVEETQEREMGTESLHEATCTVECPACHEEITLTLHVWEYPVGVANMQEILADGAEVVQECDLRRVVELED